MNIKQDNLILSFSKEEALILFDWLSRFNDDDKLRLKTFNDQAEERVLFDLESELEKKLKGVLSANYKEDLQSAWNLIRDRD